MLCCAGLGWLGWAGLGWAGPCAVTRDSFSYSHVQPGDVMPCPSRACHYYLYWILCGHHGHSASAVFWSCPHRNSSPVSRHHRISNLAPHPRQQLDFAGAFINVLVSRYWRWKVHKIFYDLCHHLSGSYLDRRLCGRVSAWPGLTSPVRWHGDTGLHAAVCYRLFLLSQPAAATIVLTTIKVIS